MPPLAQKILDSLEILPLESLKLHEQTIAPNISSLTESMLNLGRLVDPLIVDRESRIVLDGNHRRQVLENLKAPLAACQSVDYMDKSIQVGGWFPAAAKVPDGLEKFRQEKVDFEAGVGALSRFQAAFMLVKGKEKRDCTIFLTEEGTLHGAISMQGKIAKGLNGENGRLEYFEDTLADEALKGGYFVFYRKNYTKQEIISEAVAGKPLPPKSTRHMIPDRIIRLNLPLGWLYEDSDEARKLLSESIRKRAVHHNVRRYTEPVIVIY